MSSDKSVNKSNLGFLGEDSQFRIVNSFVIDNHIFKRLFKIIEQNAFTIPELRVVVGVMKDYYGRRGSVPAYPMLQMKLYERCNTEDEKQRYTETLEKLKDMGTEGIEETMDLATKFFRQQNMIRTINEIKAIVGAGKLEEYDRCQAMLEEAVSLGAITEEMSSPYDSVEDDLSKQNVVTIPTGISKLDLCLGGGLDKGKLGLIIAGSGFGKTSFTTCIAGNAAVIRDKKNDERGYKTLQICFEDTPRDIHRKYFSKISQVETSRLNESDATTNMVRNALMNYKDKDLVRDNIRVMSLPSGEYTATQLKEVIKKVINEGFKPDQVIVDYFECLAPEKGTGKDSKWDQEGKTMRKFETMAKELDMAFWVPVQGNRESLDAELVKMSNAGGSIQKIQVAQVIITISKSLEDTHNQRATLSVVKNRSGKAGEVFNGIRFNNGTCTITCEDVVDFDNPVVDNW